MKRWFLIIGIGIILILISIWMFLLFASNETKQDIYNAFGFTGETEEGVLTDIIDAVLPDLEEEKPPLRQLTTRRVAGYTEVIMASSSPQIYFVEAGTGHVYSLNLQNGAETKVSNTTIAGVKTAAVAKDGSMVALKSGEDMNSSLTILLLNQSDNQTFTINGSVLDFTITDDNELLYSAIAVDGVRGRKYNLETKNSETIFTIPFRQTKILWGKTSDDTHHVIPKTTRLLEGYLYAITPTGLSRTQVSGYGLSALVNDSYAMYTETKDDEYKLYVENKTNGGVAESFTFFFPEKCTISSLNIALCGQDNSNQVSEFPDNWYRGEVGFVDELWSINLETLEAKFLLDTLEVSGREVDVINPTLSKDEFSLYFKNKIDHTLWVYDVVTNP